jgi:hypothetical protein
MRLALIFSKVKISQIGSSVRDMYGASVIPYHPGWLT